MDDIDNQLPHTRTAIGRLERSVQRLEKAMAGHHGDLFLAQELTDAREDYARLDGATRLVEERLDGVIERLKVILED